MTTITATTSGVILDQLGFVEEDTVFLCDSLCYARDFYGEPYLCCSALQSAWDTLVWNDPRSHAPYTPNEDALFEDIPF